MTKSTTKSRASVKVKQEHHRLLKDRRDATGKKLEALVDEVIEAGLKVKRWIPNPDMVEAA